MVTGYPQLLVAPPTTGSTRAALDTTRRAETGRLQARPGIVGRMFRQVGQLICGLSGHDRILKYEQNRVALVCASCGHASPGWELTAPMPQLRFAGDPKRHELRPAPARVTSRRVA
jgi:hypothetical protein